MNWLKRMNWPFLEDDDAKAIWDEARRRYFEEDEPLDTAFTEALHKQGFNAAIFPLALTEEENNPDDDLFR